MRTWCSTGSRLPYLPLIAAIMCLIAYAAAYIVLDLLSSHGVVLRAATRDRIFVTPVVGFFICEPVAVVAAIRSWFQSRRGQTAQLTPWVYLALIVSCLLIPVWLLTLLMLAYAFGGRG